MSEPQPPILGKPMSSQEILDTLTNPEMLAEMSWALHDWGEAAAWLTEKGAPEQNSHGNRASMLERFEWYMEQREVGDKYDR